jgi:putative ABC transport system permease protein
MFFQWNYLNERMHQDAPGREGLVGWYILNVSRPQEMPGVAKAIDDFYLNSRASTKTETEREFAQSFVSMSSAIITSLEVTSFVLVSIILLVLANTMLMSARERMREYAVMKTIGFTRYHMIGLIGGESMLMAATGGLLGLALTFPLAAAIGRAFPTMFPVFEVETITILLAMAIALLAGFIAALFPATRAVRMRIAEGLRSIG